MPLLASPNIEDLQTQAVQQRAELRQLKKAIEANQYLIQLNEGKLLPTLSVGGALGYQGFGYHFDSQQDYALLQMNLSVPIFSGKQNRSRIQQSKIELDKVKKRNEEVAEQIKLQVIDAYRSLQAAETSMTAKASAAKSAEESFKIINRKYQENQVILVEYLDARTKFTNSQIGLAIARYEVLIKQAELDRVLSL